MRVFLRNVLISTTALLAAATGASAQEGNAANGEKLFEKCLVCHTENAPKSQRGPSLAGVFGRKAATGEDYPYSDAMRAAGAAGLVWNGKELEAFIKTPQKRVKGSWMTFSGVTGKQDIKDVVAYLKQLSQ